MRITRDGFAVLRPGFLGGYEVIGVGFDSIGAIRDANWRDNQCSVPDARYFDHRPDWLIVEAKVTVTYTAADRDGARQKNARLLATRAMREIGVG